MMEIGVPSRMRISRSGISAAPLADFLEVDETQMQPLLQPLVGLRRRLFGGGIAVDRLHLVRNQRLFAPAALADAAYHRAAWDLRPFPFSDETWEHLQAECPDPLCRHRQGWHHTLGVEVCDLCGEPLAIAGASLVPETDRDALRAAIGLFHHDPAKRAVSAASLPDWLRAVDPGDVLDLIVALAGVCDPSIRCRTAKRALQIGAAAERVSAAVAVSWRLLEDWPVSFERLAAERCGRRPTRFGDGNGGATMDFLLLGDLVGTPAFLAAVAGAEIARLRGEAHQTGIEMVNAGGLRGLKPTDLACARRAGIIPTVFAVSGDRPVPLLHRETVETLSRRFVETTPIDVAAVGFGCTVHGIEQLIESGLLGADDHLHMPLTGGNVRLPIASVRDLAEAVSRCSRPSEPGWVRFGRASCAIGGMRKPYGLIVQGMLSGNLPFHLAAGPGPLLERVSVPSATFTAMLGLEPTTSGSRERNRAELVTKSDAMTELNLHVRDATTVLAQWPTSKGAPAVPVPWLEDMCHRFITALEVSARLGVHGLSAISLLRSADIVPERQHLYDRAIVQRLVVGWPVGIRVSN
ncbi:hypothetical protein [Sphingomonas aerolata]|uniref:hypothetical protein n=1 Tax=Sphingomonas aerolata TaxID=185951 RepID=UPI002FE28428